MADIDKVTKGLECHKNGLCQIDDKTSCPYWEFEKDCSKHLMGDALELLKEQQAEIERLKEEKERAIRDIDLYIDDCRKELHSTFSKGRGYQLGIKRGLVIAKEILQGTRNHG